VLITDGAENEGSMTVAAATLKRKDVELLVIDTGDSINANSEVYIDSVDVPDVIHEGDNFNVTVTTVSNVETDGILTLYEGRTVKSRSQVHLTKGTNQFIFNDTGTAGSISWYKAVIEPDEDTLYINNTALTYAQIDTKPRVLLIEGTSGEGNEFEKVLQAANIDYDKVTPRGVPEDISDLTVYKAVIMLNVYSSDLPTGFDDTLSTYVKDFAGGFVCIGGDSSYALGGYRNTAINDILPVNCELQGTEASPTIAMTMVIDHSGSMSDSAMSGENSSLTCLTLAKQAAMAAVSELRTVDEVGVLAFDDTYDWVVPRTNVDDVDSIKNEISSIADGGGTSIYPALYQAYEDMLESDAKIKHIILLTDGQDGYNYYDDFIKKANADGITISTVAVGQGADTETLEYIAEKCGGRYYYTDASNDVPKIFAQEVYLSSDTYLINEEFYPVITAQSEILNGVFDNGEPPLYGYVATTAKQTATVILESSRGDPILATWQYGLGRTVAWCSDGTNEWTGAYADWEQYPLLWSNIISYVISDTDIGEDSLEVNHKGNSAQIVFETDEYDSNTAVTAIITDDDGNENEISLNVTKPGVYEGDITFDTTGMYSINVRKSQGDDVIKSYNTAYANQYSDEYKFCDSVSFEEDVTASGGKIIDFDEDIWDIKDSAITSRKSITVPIIIIAMLLFLFDIVNRRFLLDIPGRLLLLTGKIKRNGKERHIRRQEKKETTIASKAENVKQNKDKKTETKKNEQAQTQAALDVNALLKKKQDRQ
jgi:uncharacterized membrane protein